MNFFEKEAETMVGSVEVKAISGLSKGSKAEILSKADFDPNAVIDEPLPPVVDGIDGDKMGNEQKREIVLGRNVHTSCLAVTEPEPNDEDTGDKEAYMASVLARYRKTLTDRTKHHLGM